MSVAGFGVADAEHVVLKEIGRAWPEARASIVGIRRTGEDRIVEEFTVEYIVSADVQAESVSETGATGAAFRHARRIFSGTRYRRTEWSRVSPPAS